MLGISLDTLKYADVGTAWQAPGMGGYLGVAYRFTAEDDQDSSSDGTFTRMYNTMADQTIEVGDTILVLQQRDADSGGSSYTPSSTRPFVYLLKASNNRIYGGDRATGSVSQLMADPLEYAPSLASRESVDSEGPVLTGELFELLFGDAAWNTSTIDALETARTGSGVW